MGIGIIILMALLANTSTVSANNQTDAGECNVTISIDSSGMAFDKTDVSIDVGDTVCWIWENESMGHNVAEVDSEDSDERTSGGVYSGEPATTADFRHTFTEDETFHYICEPHVAGDMRGKITVGEGTPIQSEERETPGFNMVLGIVSIGCALMVTVFKELNGLE